MDEHSLTNFTYLVEIRIRDYFNNSINDHYLKQYISNGGGGNIISGIAHAIGDVLEQLKRELVEFIKTAHKQENEDEIIAFLERVDKDRVLIDKIKAMP